MIAEALQDYALATRRAWSTDRSNTVGASEIGQCMRRVAFAKNEDDAAAAIVRDTDHEDGWGATTRGSVFEDHFWVPAMRRRFGDRLMYAGKEQRTFVSGYLSATPDGLLVDMPKDTLAHLGVEDIGGDCLPVDCKTVDPRTNLVEPKLDHVFQVQVQVGLIRETTNHRPEWGLLSYSNASFWDEVTEFPIRFDQSVFDQAKRRARQIMTSAPTALPVEGVIAGGKECALCPFTGACGRARANLVPAAERAIGGADVEEIATLARLVRVAEQAETKAGTEVRELKQRIRDLMTAAGTRKVAGVATWSAVKGRSSWDNDGVRKAAEAAGVDLSPFRRVGDPSDMLTINLKL